MSLNVWTIYDHPSDYPNNFVARRFEWESPTDDVLVADTLVELRKNLPPGLVPIARDASDDPCIVESWL